MSDFFFEITKKENKRKKQKQTQLASLIFLVSILGLFFLILVSPGSRTNDSSNDLSDGDTSVAQLVLLDELAVCESGTKEFVRLRSGAVPQLDGVGGPQAEEVFFSVSAPVTSLQFWENSSDERHEPTHPDFNKERAKLFYQNNNGNYIEYTDVILDRSRYQVVSGFPPSTNFKLETLHGLTSDPTSFWDLDAALACIVPNCTVTNPTAPVITSPTNNTVLSENRFALRWQQNGTFGEGCPTVRTYDVLLQADCNGSFINYQRALEPTILNTDITALDWGREYCFKVRKNNGSASADSNVIKVRTELPPELKSYSHGNDICQNKAIGRNNLQGTTNPLKFSFRYRDMDGDDLRLLGLAIVPYSSSTPPATLSEQIVLSRISNQNALGIRANMQSGRIEMINSNGSWQRMSNNLVPVNDVSSPLGFGTANAVLLTDGDNPIAQVNSNASVDVDLNIRFENNFPHGSYGIYTYGVSETSTGKLISSNAGAASDIVFELVDTWRVDMSLPVVNLPSPVYQSSSVFNLNYSISDNHTNITDVNGYVYSDIAGAVLTDTTTGQVISPPDSKIAYPDDTPNLNYSALSDSRTYQVADPDAGPSYVFSVFGTDEACNYNDGSIVASVPAPWSFFSGSSVSGAGGIANIAIPNQNFSLAEINYSGSTYFATDEVISGTFSKTKNNVSAQDKYALTYDDRAIEPPIQFTYRNWFEHLRERVQNNFDGYAESTITQLSGSIAQNLGVSTGQRVVREIPGDLTVQADTTCDARAMIFVNGNLTVIPNLTTNNNKNGCTFVVSGDIVVQNGSLKSTSGSSSGYDVVEGFFVANGEFKTNEDSNSGAYWDGLLIKGGVISDSLDLNRDLNFDGNAKQPAQIFHFDPRYREMFRSELSSTRYSIRERGL